MKFYSYAAAMVVAAGITFSGLKPAYGELVFEDDLNAKPAVKTESIAAPAVQNRIEEKNDLSKAETMRRQRLREELKNEDLLTQKLEELRLKDEMKRTDELLGSGVNKSSAAVEPMQEVKVGAAAAAPAPTATAPGTAMQVSPNGSSQMVDVGSSGMRTEAHIASSETSTDSNRVTVTPRFGTSSIMNSIYDVSAKFSTGFNISLDVSDNIAFSGGYSYSSYSLGAGNSMQYGVGFNTSSYLQTVNLNDNVIDMGVKAYFLGPKSKVRPFVGGGGAYRKGYVNYDETTQNQLKRFNQYAAQDVEISGFAGYVETGLEFKITNSISLSGTFRYFNILSSRQSNPVDPNAFLNSAGYGYYGYNGGLAPGYYGGLSNGYGTYGYSNDTRAAASDALAKNNFYQLVAGVSISF